MLVSDGGRLLQSYLQYGVPTVLYANTVLTGGPKTIRGSGGGLYVGQGWSTDDVTRGGLHSTSSWHPISLPPS